MEILDPGVYIRSLATRGSLGGLSAATREVADVLDAFGFDRIVIETVGVGQSETAVADLIEEVKKLRARVQPDEVLLVADGALGQEAVNGGISVPRTPSRIARKIASSESPCVKVGRVSAGPRSPCPPGP